MKSNIFVVIHTILWILRTDKDFIEWTLSVCSVVSSNISVYLTIVRHYRSKYLILCSLTKHSLSLFQFFYSYLLTLVLNSDLVILIVSFQIDFENQTISILLQNAETVALICPSQGNSICIMKHRHRHGWRTGHGDTGFNLKITSN